LIMFESNVTKVRTRINSFLTVTNDETGKNFTVYCVEVVYKGQVKTLEKRYSEFYEVYKKLNKVHGVKINFPPKHVLNKDNRLLESRRVGLESYLKAMLHEYQGNIPQLLLDFLELGNINDDSDSECDATDYVTETNYITGPTPQLNVQPMITFKQDAFLEPTTKELQEERQLPSIVIKGALHAIYNS